mmetsp:Transcript_23522/g.65432  ORF Transcript_23522/g.65432 Transcript_23522/m.65432 type:complete len:340 (+) Transcript_23522:111-1130(+)|eukprot:CAMPEP_0168748484 /NCGR_PEP_ID=MMETSP0724-20121128/16201_1 /TAXON_ID=265536 /ORGANISM="Amphiprora sp., Strain CCMP467" /LENGTH=339 /DNA_ID=CAMNT_0008796317 /DNA_START=68 /DNA_END=1087 /DNA_ORIENTATION=+
MGFLDTVKKTAAQAKLMGEMAWLDRQIEKEKRKMGVDLFTVLLEWEFQNEGQQLPSFLADDTAKTDNDKQIGVIFMAAKQDVMTLADQKKVHEYTLDELELASHSDNSLAEKKTGYRARNAVASTNARARMAYLDREVYVRKEIFGMQIYEELRLGTPEDLMSKSGHTSKEGEVKDEILTPQSPAEEPVVEVLKTYRLTFHNLLSRKVYKQQQLRELRPETDEGEAFMIPPSDGVTLENDPGARIPDSKTMMPPAATAANNNNNDNTAQKDLELAESTSTAANTATTTTTSTTTTESDIPVPPPQMAPPPPPPMADNDDEGPPSKDVAAPVPDEEDDDL